MKTRITLVRHGLTNENLTFTMIGVTDPPLHDLGFEVLQKVGERLQHQKFDRAYASPLKRAIQSADQIIRFQKGLELAIEPRIAEINLGIWEGRLSSDVFANKEIDPVVKDALDEDLPDFKVPGGEGRREALERFKAGLTEIAVKDPGGNVLVVTHGGLLALLHCEYKGESLGRFRYHHPKHGSISSIEVTFDEATTSKFDESHPYQSHPVAEIGIDFTSFDDQIHIDDELEERIKTISSAMRHR